MRWKQVAAIVAAVTVGAVLAPVGVEAATGQLVNIVDPFNAARGARVTNSRTLMVESRPGVPQDSFQVSGSRLGLGWVNLTSVTAPQRLALTEMTFAARGPVSDTAQEVLIEAMVRTTGANGCTGPGTSGYTRHTLRRILVKNQSTSLSITFPGPPLILPGAASGHVVCLGFTVVTVPSGSAMDVGATGYRYTPL